MNKEELYNNICFLLTDYENAENKPNDLITKAFYNILVDVQRYFDNEIIGA